MVKNLEDYAVILSEKDNVATALVDLPAGDYVVRHQSSITVPQDIKAGFKLALSDIGEGRRVYKYGYVIGLATADIKEGQCVHVHNLISAV